MAEVANLTENEVLVGKLDNLLTKVTRLEYAILFLIVLMFSLFTLTLVILR